MGSNNPIGVDGLLQGRPKETFQNVEKGAIYVAPPAFQTDFTGYVPASGNAPQVPPYTAVLPPLQPTRLPTIDVNMIYTPQWTSQQEPPIILPRGTRRPAPTPNQVNANSAYPSVVQPVVDNAPKNKTDGIPSEESPVPPVANAAPTIHTIERTQATDDEQETGVILRPTPDRILNATTNPKRATLRTALLGPYPTSTTQLIDKVKYYVPAASIFIFIFASAATLVTSSFELAMCADVDTRFDGYALLFSFSAGITAAIMFSPHSGRALFVYGAGWSTSIVFSALTISEYALTRSDTSCYPAFSQATLSISVIFIAVTVASVMFDLKSRAFK